MKRPTGWLKAFAVVSTFVLVAAACGSASSSSAAPSVAPPSAAASSGASPEPSTVAHTCPTTPVNLSIWGGYPEMDAVFKKAGESFKTIHPNVDLTIFSTDLRGFEQKLTTALPSGTGGDIIVRTTNFLSRFIDQDLLLPIPPDLLEYGKSAAFVPALVEDSTYKGELRGIPLFNGGTALFYNTDMLAEAGLTEPPATMEQIWEYAAKLAKLDGDGNVVRSGISLRLSGQGSGVAEKFWILLMQYGKSLISEVSEGKYKVDYNGPEGAALLGRYVDALKNKIDSPNIEHDAKAFETLATAMFARESWVIADIATNAPDLVGHYGTISLPKANLGGGEYMFVPKASQNVECAWEFIKYLTDQQQQLDLVTIAGWMPARADLDVTEFLVANPGYKGFFEQPPGMTTDFYAPIPEYDEIITKLATHLVDAYADFENLSGNPAKIQELLDTWAAETKEILKANDHLAE
jgi:multiple sugar transport system substrate-binding protein